MADFSTFDARCQAFEDAAAALRRIRAAYQVCVGIRDLLAAYTDATNPALVTAINSAYTAAQRSELSVIAGKLAAVAADLEANHASAIGG